MKMKSLCLKILLDIKTSVKAKQGKEIKEPRLRLQGGRIGRKTPAQRNPLNFLYYLSLPSRFFSEAGGGIAASKKIRGGKRKTEMKMPKKGLYLI